MPRWTAKKVFASTNEKKLRVFGARSFVVIRACWVLWTDCQRRFEPVSFCGALVADGQKRRRRSVTRDRGGCR